MDLKYSDYCWDGPSFRQRDLTVTQTYDAAYLRERYAAIDDKVRALSAARLRVLEAFVPERGWLLDYGAGTFRFVEAAVEAGWHALGYDAVAADHPHSMRFDRPGWMLPDWRAATFFDSLEHLTDPAGVIRELRPQIVMISVPECHYPEDPDWFMRWKHRRPGEHLWHWRRDTLAAFMEALGYRALMVSHFEDDYRPNPAQAEPNILTAIYRRGL